MADNSVILFHSHNYAIWASRVLNEIGIENKLIPVPREFSSDCGYCIRINTSLVSDALIELIGKKVQYDRVEGVPNG